MIKIATPKVYLISRPSRTSDFSRFTQNELGMLLPCPTNVTASERIVEEAGRVCYMSYGKGRKTNKEFIENIVESGHHSVLEHANWSLLITGVSRSLSHEFVRHRHFSYSQLSQRYVDSSDVAFVEPEAIANDPFLHGPWMRLMEICLDNYRAIEFTMRSKYNDEKYGLDAVSLATKTTRTKLARQAARSVLPNATETKMVITGNARAWMHFFEMRGSVHADVEIRRLAVMILEVLKQEAPTIFANYIVKEGLIDVERKGGREIASGA